ncbi:UDP-N-acetylglucosamine 2-epimerase (non-hydrolyzing) [Limosilactobacillus mucosae]|uniref:UDP-N-acetylglucosamine 2-epimerase (non-hydrolyzing) n=1 Tax=Limosilactobacillus mucosae TaxID=97478 RepID=A0AAJ1HVP9_LIMMU|nr:UDP-N-acetylglucosamine 2-epimerase (non-hydrolyzing) [Limosilactobacillus mucosae]MDC2830447.1 UDP-N-acetylglucosamine 2-epimerase (non-hydrolyzing) [Limosilactobacillus mucosae]MDC2838021.1 UDP-N-acetylglucosamine 2-epimerase (non-hydrolyzing) [Limosilactobacillus mucosae]MDC2848645.1 UDP-N-acetylglucosamine 2-epimerase (non-hydrolyzing) [Limosilactobacillus mucosae]MDC2854063.1 UDP-N-acetylglucosamine 2-epimerase (non-hydrolyzing) [Limosilactobacillus mucosae]
MGKKRIMVIFGTRPEAIKMVPVIKTLELARDLEPIVVVTAQHREMLDQVLAAFNVVPAFDLNLMSDQQTLTKITVSVLSQMEQLFQKFKPDAVLVHGDTTTTLAASLAAFYQQVPVGHVEAGLRTWEKYDPFPEEINRQLTDTIAQWYFAPTERSRQNLLKEHHNDQQIYITGTTAIDVLAHTIKDQWQMPILDQIQPDAKLILLTMHRRENQGAPMQEAFDAINDFVLSHPEVEVLSPNVQKAAHQAFDDNNRVHLIAPLNVIDFHNLAARSWLIMTDSGGIQEEAPSLGKPVLVLRDTTERPEGVAAGTLKLVGTDAKEISKWLNAFLNDPARYDQMAKAQNPYGDGHAAERIVNVLRQELN